MSWDLFVQNIPDSVSSPREIPDDFRPRPLGRRDDIIRRILEIIPEADFTDPSWGTIRGEGFSIELNMGEGEVLESFALHVRGGDQAVVVITGLLDHLGFRALDPGSDSGIFHGGDDALESFRSWRAFRDRVCDRLRPPPPPPRSPRVGGP